MSEQAVTYRPKKTRRRAGSLKKARLMLWESIRSTEALLKHEPDAKTAIALLHAVSQGTGQYAALVKYVELENRLKSLERELRGQGQGDG